MCSLIGNDYKCSCIGDFFGKNCQNKKLNSTIFENSTILTDEKSLDLLNLLGLNKTSYQLLYQASIDGFSANSFHSKCDGVFGILTVIKSNNSNIFGGYTSVDWSGNYQYKYDQNAFLFSLVNSYNVSVKMNPNTFGWSIYCEPSFNFAYGQGYDLFCSDHYCYSNLGYSYQLPSFLTLYSKETQSFLAGSYDFQPVEIEVYRVDSMMFFIYIKNIS